MAIRIAKASALACALALTSCTTSPPPAPAATAPAGTAAPSAATGSAAPSAATGSAAPFSAAILAHNCFTCHGPRGRSPGAIPSLNALGATDIATMLKQFKSGERAGTVMGRHAKAYSDNEIDAVAGYIAGLNKK